MSNIVGIDKRSMASIDHARLDYKVVLVEGEVKDVSAYIGIGPAEWVALHGDKLSIKHAEAHFPGFEASLKINGCTYRD